MTEMDGDMWHRLLFRDYLRSHPEEARQYIALKEKLAVEHREDREAYTAAKADYVDFVMEKAIAESSARNS